MNKRLLTIFLTAFLVAALCAFFVYRVVVNRLSTSHPATTTRVVTAATDIKLGTVLTAADVTTTGIAGQAPKGAVLKPEDAIGRGVLADIYQGEVILDSRLAASGAGGGLASTINPGMRACAVKVDDVVGVAGFVTPGMHVDVIISGNVPGSPNEADGPQVKTLLQNIEVLSAGTDIQRDAAGPKQVQVVNLLVTPAQAEILSLASNQTHIQLVLRNPLDTKVTQTPGTSMAHLFGAATQTPESAHTPATGSTHKPPTPRSHTDSIEVINGSQRSVQKVTTPEAQP